MKRLGKQTKPCSMNWWETSTSKERRVLEKANDMPAQ